MPTADPHTDSLDPEAQLAVHRERLKAQDEKLKAQDGRIDTLEKSWTDELRGVREALGQMLQQLSRIQSDGQKIDGGAAQLRKEFDAHAAAQAALRETMDKRVRALELWRAGLGGAAVLGGLLWGWAQLDLREARASVQANAQLNVLQTEKISDLRERVQRLEGRQQ